ncbi:MAG TPA: hypothetical protein VMU11_04415 [Verrucomicrobiae bacterium]|nr:hypothetical protein [Verrucomicrobiae bacterium]
MNATMTGQRWGVRLLSLVYYFALIPLLIDLFSAGARPRSFYLFSYVVLAVSGLQIGYKESDNWVKAWFLINFVFQTMITAFAFFWSGFAALVMLAPWEKWVHLCLLAVALVFLGLNRLLPPIPMKPVSAEEDVEAGLPPVPNQNPAQ